MTKETYFKAQGIRSLIIEMESTLSLIKSQSRIHVFTYGNGGGNDYNLSEKKEIDAVLRGGMIEALEKRIEELKAEFESL